VKQNTLLFALTGPLLCGALAARPARAAETMVKIVYRALTPQTDPKSFAAMPRTLYRQGVRYARMEEEPDRGRDLQSLLVIDEPNVWQINLLKGTGQHIMDPGPTFEFRAPILAPGPGESTKDFAASARAGFEFGRELEFLRAHGAAQLAATVIDGRKCDPYKLKLGGQGVILYVLAGTRKPWRLAVFQNDKLALAVMYDRYETDLPPEPRLFAPPAGIALTEAR
jgi:hypothetical protein